MCITQCIVQQSGGFVSNIHKSEELLQMFTCGQEIAPKIVFEVTSKAAFEYSALSHFRLLKIYKEI